jgi:hypothetical protein
METWGGARVDCDAKTTEAGLRTCDPATSGSTLLATIAVGDGCGCADWRVVTARQQSWLQQPGLPTVRRSDSELAEPWHWWAALRTQQACEGVAVTASASGTKVPTSANNNKNLAVRRCMFFYVNQYHKVGQA